MLPRFGFARLLCFVLLIGAFLAFIDSAPAEAEEALASWYGPDLAGKPTASGELYDPNAYTAAHRTLPFGTELIVSYGGRSVPVTVNDRGPYVRGLELDLSQAAARELGLTRVGVDYVDWTYADKPDPAQGVAQEPALPQESAQEPELAPAGAEPSYDDGGSYEVSPPGYPRSYPPAQPEASSGAYTVQPGDTLSEIAAQLGTTVDELASHNGITDPNIIYSGQALYLPTVGVEPVGHGVTPLVDGTVAPGLPSIGDNVVVSGEDVSMPAPGNGDLQAPDRTVVHDGAVAPDGGVVTGNQEIPAPMPGS